MSSLLPRESISKEVDASLLSVISFPAFAVEDERLAELTRNRIIRKLKGKYGCKRFLRDGYRTAVEDTRRLYYEPAELKVFENIECEWPVFFTYLILDGIISGNTRQVEEYKALLEPLLLFDQEGYPLVPELYYVPSDRVAAEREHPHTQERLPSAKVPLMWAQSLYILGCLLDEGLVAVGEIDPLNRRHSTVPRPDLVVQIAVLAEDPSIQHDMDKLGIEIQLKEESSIQIFPAHELNAAYKDMGRSDVLGLSGRLQESMGSLSTSKLYAIRDKIFAFTPQIVDQRNFYISLDNEFLVDDIKTYLSFVRANWRLIGRPTLTLVINRAMVGDSSTMSSNALVRLIQSFKTGTCDGVRVRLGSLQQHLTTSCVERLGFLDESDFEFTPTASVRPTTQQLQLNEEETLYLADLHKEQMGDFKNMADSDFDHDSHFDADVTRRKLKRRNSVSGIMLRSRTTSESEF